jgi:polysaccharide biosynthesis protein PslH
MEKPVKILSLVSYKFLPPDMGGQKGIAFFNRYLSRYASITCITVIGNDATQHEGYQIKKILSNSPFRYINVFYFFKLRTIIRKENITHLIIEHPYYGWLGILLKRFCRVKLIVHSHNIESLRFKTIGKWWWGILWNYEKITHRQADYNFFIQDNDKNYAIANFRLLPDRCSTITYGFELNNPPSAAEKKAARSLICQAHHIEETDRLLLFNGTLGYKPNLDALGMILNKINPQLMGIQGFNYKIIICGNKLPASYSGLVDYKEKNIIYAGFVDDITLYFKGCDIFINPVTDGGGIKTKIVEALGYDLAVVSTQTGAIGVAEALTDGKLKIAGDEDWAEFTFHIKDMDAALHTPPVFFENFYWDNIAKKAAALIEGCK